MENTQEFKKPDNGISFDEFILLLIRRKKFILGTFVIAVAAAAIFSSPFFLPPKYKSEIIFYPPSNNSGRSILDDNLYFGVDKEIDEEIQILKSSILRDSLISKYKLMEHYGIDPAAKYKLNELHERINNSIKIERTRYNSISVIVEDIDPAMAANIANDMVRMGDEVKFRILKQNLKIIYLKSEKENLKQLKSLDTLSKQISSIDADLFKSDQFKINEANSLDLLKSQMDIREMIKNAIETKNQTLLDLLYQYESRFSQFVDGKESLKDINKKLSSENVNSFIITPAEVADKKSSPVRSLIVIMVGICSILAAIALILSVEKYKALKAKFMK